MTNYVQAGATIFTFGDGATPEMRKEICEAVEKYPKMKLVFVAMREFIVKQANAGACSCFPTKHAPGCDLVVARDLIQLIDTVMGDREGKP